MVTCNPRGGCLFRTKGKGTSLGGENHLGVLKSLNKKQKISRKKYRADIAGIVRGQNA